MLKTRVYEASVAAERHRCEPPPRWRRRSPRSFPPDIRDRSAPVHPLRPRHPRTVGLTSRTCPTFPVSRTYRLADVGEASGFLMFARDVGRPLPPPHRRRPRATKQAELDCELTEGTTKRRHVRSRARAVPCLRPTDLDRGRETPLKAVSSRLTTHREPSRDRAHPVSPSPRSAPT